jgi:hypothetical protein
MQKYVDEITKIRGHNAIIIDPKTIIVDWIVSLRFRGFVISSSGAHAHSTIIIVTVSNCETLDKLIWQIQNPIGKVSLETLYMSL